MFVESCVLKVMVVLMIRIGYIGSKDQEFIVFGNIWVFNGNIVIFFQVQFFRIFLGFFFGFCYLDIIIEVLFFYVWIMCEEYGFFVGIYVNCIFIVFGIDFFGIDEFWSKEVFF